MNNETIKKIALENGFKLKDQLDGSADLNPYVYDFAKALIDKTTSAKKTYFLYDPQGGGFEEYETLEERDAAAHDAILFRMDDGWDENVDEITSGFVTHRATKTNLINRPDDSNIDEDGYDEEGNYWGHEFDYICDYEMKPIEENQ